MAKAAVIKTRQTASSVTEFLSGLPDVQKRKDSQVILKLMEEATKEKPKMWGSSLVGFGLKRYKSPATGREVDWFLIGFSPRKANLSLHLVIDFNQLKEELNKLGKFKTGVGCLYINKLEDVDLKILKKIIMTAVKKGA